MKVNIPANIEQVDVGGFKVNIRKDNWEQDRYVIQEVIEQDCYGLAALCASSLPVELVVDVGGHMGTFGLMVKRLWPRARIVAIEPFESSAELYEMNLEANGMDGVEVIRKAVSYDVRKKILVIPDAYAGNVKLTTEGHAFDIVNLGKPFWNFDGVVSQNENYRVVSSNIPTCRIEDVVPDRQRIDILKTDCEGSEYDIVAGMSSTLATRVLRIIGERHGDGDELGWLCRTKFPHLMYRDRSRYWIDFFEMVPRE